ncbi:MAG: LysR family transcriptional regulator [Castellaniella sp.]|nr:LysR family transcriptional regulator [Castellaniella sp.]
MTPSLNDIEVFVEVARSHGFTRAAEALDMPASTISRHITQLEKTIGVQLLNRSTRKVMLTEAGAAYFSRCQHIIEEARIAHEMLIEGAYNPRGRLKVSMPSSLATAILQEPLWEFSRRYPEIECEYDLSIRKIDLHSDPYDIVIRVAQPEDSSIVSRRLGLITRGLYASADYLHAHGVPTQPADLVDHECVRASTERGDSIWQLFSQSGQEQQVRVKGRIALNHVLLMRRMAESGAGIVPLSVQDMPPAGLIRVLPGWEFEPLPLIALYPSRMMPARARVFLDFLVERLAHVRIFLDAAMPVAGPERTSP